MQAFFICASPNLLQPDYRVVSGLVGAGSFGARFGKFGVPGDGGAAEGLTCTVGLNSLA
jgi:hypothetical protein